MSQPDLPAISLAPRGGGAVISVSPLAYYTNNLSLDLATKRALTRQAIKDSIPLDLPAIPFGLVLGLAITESGINGFVGWLSAPIIFGGAAQLTLISLLGAGSAWVAAVTAGLVVNARHLMYSAALAPTFQKQPRWFRWLGPYTLLDQVFALVSVRPDEEPAALRRYYLSASALFWSVWMVTVAAGLFLGPIVPTEWNLGIAVPLMFLGLIVIGIDKWPKVAAAVTAAGVTYLFAGLPNRAGLLVGAVAGVVAGYLIEVNRSE